MIKFIDIIREFIHESTNPNVYLIYCKIVVNSDQRPVVDILSDVRAITGVTVVDITGADDKTHGVRHVIILSLKIDPSPFHPFSKTSYSEILNEIKKIPAVLAAKYTSIPKAI